MGKLYVGVPIQYIGSLLTQSRESTDSFAVVEDPVGNKYGIERKFLYWKQAIVYDDINSKANWTHVVFEESQTAPNPTREPMYAIYKVDQDYFMIRVVHVKNTSKYYIVKPSNGELIGILGYYNEYNSDGTLRMSFPVVFVNESLSDWAYFPVLEIVFSNGRKLYIYANFGVGVLIGIGIATLVGWLAYSWGVSQLNYSEAAKLNAQANLIKAENEKTALQLGKEAFKSIKEDKTLSPEQKAELIKHVLNIIAGVRYTNEAIKNPPKKEEDNTNQKYEDKKKSWWDRVVDFFMGNWQWIVGGVAGIIATYILVFKFNIIRDIIDSLREMTRRLREK